MLNENGRLGGLVKSQETLLGRGIAQQLVLEEGILGASRGPKRQAPGSLHHDLELARVGVAPGLGDQVLQRSLQLGLFLGLLDDGLQSGEAPFGLQSRVKAPPSACRHLVGLRHQGLALPDLLFQRPDLGRLGLGQQL